MKERRPSIPPQGPLSTAKQFTPSTIKMTFSSTIGAIQLNRDSESALSRVSSPDHIYILRFLKLTSSVMCPLSTNPFHMSWVTNNSCYYFSKVSQFVCPSPDQHQRRLLSTYTFIINYSELRDPNMRNHVSLPPLFGTACLLWLTSVHIQMDYFVDRRIIFSSEFVIFVWLVIPKRIEWMATIPGVDAVLLTCL